MSFSFPPKYLVPPDYIKFSFSTALFYREICNKDVVVKTVFVRQVVKCHQIYIYKKNQTFVSVTAGITPGITPGITVVLPSCVAAVSPVTSSRLDR